MAADRFHIKQHDQRPDLKVRLLDDDTAVDLTNAASAKLLMSNRRAGLKVDAPMDILDQAVPATIGVVSYSWAVGDTDAPGEYNAEIQITWPSAKTQTFPANGYIRVIVEKDLDG